MQTLLLLQHFLLSAFKTLQFVFKLLVQPAIQNFIKKVHIKWESDLECSYDDSDTLLEKSQTVLISTKHRTYYTPYRLNKLNSGISAMCQRCKLSTGTLLHLHYIYIYAFSRCFYPKRLTLIQVTVWHLSALAFPGNRTHDLGVASAMLYHLSYRKAPVSQLIHNKLFILQMNNFFICSGVVQP